MTLESSLPYLSIASALAAGWASARPSGSAEPGFKAFALAALAMFAFFRGVGPASVAQALTLTAIAQAMAPRGATRLRTAGVAFLAGGWIVYAGLFARSGGSTQAFTSEPLRAVLLLALVGGAGLLVVRLWPRFGRARIGALADLGLLAVMTGAALTLPWSLWPAMAGALGVLASEALLISAAVRQVPPDGGTVRRSAWALNYLGQAAIAYAFLR